MAWVQPMTTGRFLSDLKRNMAQRSVTRQYASVPLFGLFGIIVPFFLVQSWLKKRTTGSYPQTLQPQYYLYRSNQGLYGHQHNMNSNPDNFYNRNFNCWSSDPLCALDQAPKRPWLDLKDPTKNLFKFTRDASENQHVKVHGWKGF